MTGLFLDISDYIPDPEEMAVDSAIAKLKQYGVEEEYDIIPSECALPGFDYDYYISHVHSRKRLGNW